MIEEHKFFDKIMRETLKTAQNRSFHGGDINLTRGLQGIGAGVGSTSPYELDLDWYDDFEPGNIDQHSFFRYEDVGKILCITLKTDGTDDYIVDYVYVTSSLWTKPDIWFFMKNKEETVLSKDPEDSGKLKLCENRCYRYLPVGSDNWILEKMDYKTDKGIVHPTSTIKAGEITVDARDSSSSQTSSINLATTISDTLSFEHEQGITVSSEVNFEANIPNIVSGTISISQSKSETNSFTKSNTVTKSVSFNFPCVAAAGKKVTCKAYQEKYQMEIPYQQVWKHKTQRCTYEVSGMSTVDSDSTITMEVHEE
ncbi:uncharacterized protein LOC134811956 [Bolinopsis microptera]|uniref:uncharacterized protein LOC134811956 n=1 Tax=Bolinopsis microptera TaxID=2820187 RepID=UPI00307A94C7